MQGPGEGMRGIICTLAQGQKGAPELKEDSLKFPGILYFIFSPGLAASVDCWMNISCQKPYMLGQGMHT